MAPGGLTHHVDVPVRTRREFSKGFHQKPGAGKSLALFGQLSTDTYEDGEAGPERLAFRVIIG
ncbi:hypothetical protein [Streptomyces sp. I6]|uniref:hypothetical protein n=1 Tax=Streptomyces sp. I6 TaxID=2483113 RepID=UPI000F4520F1|nr:hypothetical protein [Streptomyces sp. I6]RNL73094.1 hypothetical protein EBF04_23285 [Streptomyces sp. I6]